LYLPKLLDRYLSGGNGRMQNLEGYKGEERGDAQ